MAKQTINIGTAPNDGTGTPLRTAFDYCNLNFTELYTAVGPSGNNIVVPGTATITGDLTVRTNKLTVASTGVGINGTSAAYPLEINGGASASTSQFKSTGSSVIARFTDGTAETGYIGSGIALISGISRTDFGIASNGALVFGVSTGLGMTLNSTGLGVGVTPSAGRLHIKGGAAQSPLVLDTLGYNQIVLQLNGANRGQIYADATNCLALVDSTGSNLRLVVTDTGNVGVGVTPSAWSSFKALQVGSGLAIASSGVSNSRMFGNTYYDGAYKYMGTGRATQYEQDGYHAWYISASGTAGNAVTFTPAMTLDASGNLLVGTTSGSFGSRLIISADSGTTSWATGPLAAAPLNYYITANNTQGVFLNGTSATAWTAISDERFKDIIEPITNAVSKVGSLRSVIGKFKTDAEGTRRSFLIAQDVLAAFPEAAVANNPDKLGVTYTEVIPLLVAAIKELTAEVNALKNA
jgi:hypothetical protein